MCGIAGFVDCTIENQESLATAMADAVKHRGPDDSGQWCDRESGVGFGFRRLAILDLSPEGHQPMRSRSGRYVLVFNGEIYNYLELRDELKSFGHAFRGGSDTEVILAAFEQWGVSDVFAKLNGMFAIAVWDCAERKLTLARDRLGKKPVYYGWSQGAFLFGSELKSFRVHPKFLSEVSQEAAVLFMKRGYISAPHTIYRNYFKLIPGSFLTLEGAALRERPQGFDPNPYMASGRNTPTLFWDLRALREKFDSLKISESEILQRVDELLFDSVKRRMISDVPLGAFLSGGVDSSLVVALMQRAASGPVRTFSIGFKERSYDEANFARKVAEQLGTNHTELYVSVQDGLELVPRLSEIFDEPLADASQIPTFIVSELARKHVTVALTGDGGDELFTGYNRYVWPEKVLNSVGWLPLALRRSVSNAGLACPQPILRAVSQLGASLLPANKRPHRPEEAIQKMLRALAAKDPETLYDQLTTYWDAASLRRTGATELLSHDATNGVSSFIDRAMLIDLSGYLVEDLLAKVDRASMAVSLETRCPLLDYRVAELAASIPSALRAKGGGKKYILRTLLKKYLPENLVERPKMGFSVPIGEWFKGPLREWGEDLMQKLAVNPMFDSHVIQDRWQAHIQGRVNWQNELWTACMFQAWCDRFGAE